MLVNIASWLVWTLPLASSVLVPLAARVSSRVRDAFVIVVSVFTAVLAFMLVPAVYSRTSSAVVSSIPWFSSVEAGVYLDPLSVLFATLVAFFGVVIAVYSMGYMAGEKGLTRYYFFLLLFIGSMIGLVVSDNFLQLFIFWEMVGLCSYSLISFWYHRPESVRAGVKVFLMTRIGDACLLGAIGLLYSSLGTFSFRFIIQNIGHVPASTLVAVAFLGLGGAIAKSAQLPLHTWLYSAMEAPTSVSALLHAATMVKAGVYLIARFMILLGPLAATIPLWLPSVAWVGVLTAFVGATLALYTNDIKGVLAYSTISQLGFMMAALGTAEASSALGWFASLFHMVSHAFFEGLGFLLAGGIIHALGTRDMRLMGGLRKAMPYTYGLSVLMVLTTSGLPPFAAFFSKGLILTSTIESGNLLQTLLLYATTALTFAYSLRFLMLVFHGEPSEHARKLHLHEAPWVMLAPAFVLGLLCVAWGFTEPMLAFFLKTEASVNLTSAFTSSETIIFFALLVPVGLSIYLTYYKKSGSMMQLLNRLNPLSTVLKHGYFFDDVYEGIVSRSVQAFSEGVKLFEGAIFSRLPQIVADIVIVVAVSVQQHLDVYADGLLTLFARRSLQSAEKMHKVPSESVQHYLSAAIIGFILIVILIVISVGV